MKYYYAIFMKTEEAVEVEFPDLPGCLTFGDAYDEAYQNAVDVLAAWLANAEQQFVRPPSPHKTFEKMAGQIVPIPLDEKLRKTYKNSKRFSVTFPADVLERLDSLRKIRGLNRSAMLIRAAEEYIKNHEAVSE